MSTTAELPKTTPRNPPFNPNIRPHCSSLSPTSYYYAPFSPSPPEGTVVTPSLSAPAATSTSYGGLTPSYLASRPPLRIAYSDHHPYNGCPVPHLPYDGPPQEAWRTPQLPCWDFWNDPQHSFVAFTRGISDVDSRGHRHFNTGTYIEAPNVNLDRSRGPTEATQDRRYHPGLVRRAVFNLPRPQPQTNFHNFRPTADPTDEIVRKLPLAPYSVSTPTARMDGNGAEPRTSPTAGMKRKHSSYSEVQDGQESDVKPQIDQNGSFTGPTRYLDGERHVQQAREDIIPGVALNLSGANSYSQHLPPSQQKQPTRPNSTSTPSSSNIPLNVSPRNVPAMPNLNSGHSSGISRPASVNLRTDAYAAGLTNGTINPNAKGLGGESRGISQNGSGDGQNGEVSDQGHQGEKNKRKKPRVALSCAQCTKVSLYLDSRTGYYLTLALLLQRKQKCNREIPCQHCLGKDSVILCTV